MSNLSTVYIMQEMYAQAEALVAKTLEIRRRVLGQEHPDTLVSMNNLAVLYRTEAKYAEADALFLKVLEIRRRVLAAGHPETTNTLASMGQVRVRDHRYADAEPPLREALGILEKTRPDSWLRFYVLSMLGAALSGEKKYAGAEPLLLSGYAGLIERRASIPTGSKFDLTEAGQWIVQLYRDLARPDKAAEWTTKLENDKTGSAAALRK